jgi:serine/threonine protein kinase
MGNCFQSLKSNQKDTLTTDMDYPMRKDEHKRSDSTHKVTKDYKFLKVIGTGSFGKVYLVEYKDGIHYAMKVLDKRNIVDKKQNDHIMAERNVMSKVDHPFVVKMHRAFQSDNKLYFVLDFLNGGELFFHLKKEGRFTENKARFYAAEVVLALEHLHKNGIIYRDLKPENILLGDDGHIKLTDFGLSKTGVMGNIQWYTFCGTPEYLSPEIINGKGHTKSVDWWSFGLLLYEMLSGTHPFKSKRKNRQQIFNQITDEPVSMLPGFSDEASDLLTELLKIDPNERLGNSDGDADDIK